jgi:transglutaminase-like putative cysteine protease
MVAAARADDASYSIVKSHDEVEVSEGGGYVESREAVYKVLTEQGAQALRQATFSYTEGYQSYSVVAAYTLKADGTRINVDPSSLMKGYGASSSPGFQDIKTITVVFPSVEVGDEVALTTVFHQTVPWFEDGYAEEFAFSRRTSASDVRVAVTAPSDMTLAIDAAGLSPATTEQLNGKTRRVWTYSNASAIGPENDAVDEFDVGPRLVVSSFHDYRSFARTYSGMLKGRADVTPEIRALGGKLTAGLKDNRQKAEALYNWVSEHVAYVEIVLGAGGFIPNYAGSVLATKYGDCKDHVILLQALLAAEGIDSTPVLVYAGARYAISPAPDPGAFNHLITYIPSLNLYLDSTARYAAFGSLPGADAGKPVVRIASADLDRTPSDTPARASIKSVETINIATDGSVDGNSRIEARGSVAADIRSLLDAAQSLGDTQYLRSLMGPGVEGSLQRGPVGKPSETYSFAALYRHANALNIPGPGAIPPSLAYKPFSFILLISADLPSTRSRDYLCPSVDALEDLTINLPPGTTVISLPPTASFSTEGVTLETAYAQPSAGVIHATFHAVANHPAATCSAAYYMRVRPKLAQMVAALRTQILYR